MGFLKFFNRIKSSLNKVVMVIGLIVLAMVVVYLGAQLIVYIYHLCNLDYAPWMMKFIEADKTPYLRKAIDWYL